MLDYKKLSKEFTKRLNEFDKVDIESWISYDNNRMLDNFYEEEKIINQVVNTATVKIITTVKINNISDPRETISSNTSAYNFETAA